MTQVRKDTMIGTFQIEGRIRQAQRMRLLADGVVLAGKVAVADLYVLQKKQEKNLDPII